jgi:hypothetical protein
MEGRGVGALKADHSTPSSAKVKNGGDIPSFPICLLGVVDNFTFYIFK